MSYWFNLVTLYFGDSREYDDLYISSRRYSIDAHIDGAIVMATHNNEMKKVSAINFLKKNALQYQYAEGQHRLDRTEVKYILIFAELDEVTAVELKLKTGIGPFDFNSLSNYIVIGNTTDTTRLLESIQ